MLTKSILKIWFLSVNIEKFELIDGPITVERLKCCDWSVHKFTEVNFSKLTDSNQIFRIHFVSIHCHLGEFSRSIIKCNFLVHMNSMLIPSIPTQLHVRPKHPV